MKSVAITASRVIASAGPVSCEVPEECLQKTIAMQAKKGWWQPAADVSVSHEHLAALGPLGSRQIAITN